MIDADNDIMFTIKVFEMKFCMDVVNIVVTYSVLASSDYIRLECFRMC